VIGEANFSDHGANRLGASALMQGLADGYFILPYTIGNFFATHEIKKVSTDDSEFREAAASAEGKLKKMMDINGKRTVDDFHRELGKICWEHCGMSRTAEGLSGAIGDIASLREEFWENVRIPGSGTEFNMELEKAGRVADFLEFGEVMCTDALAREESCGGHYREEFKTPEGEALRDDQNYCHAAVWEYQGVGNTPLRHREELEFEYVKLATRSYK